MPALPGAFREVHNDPVTLIHRLAERKARLRLSHDVAELRIGGERRGFVQDRFPHRGLHGIARPVIPKVEILAHFRIRHLCKAGRAESAVREKRRKLDERQVIRREDEEGVPQEFVRPRPEVVESPVPLEDFRDFGDGDEVRCFLFERIEPDRHDGIGRIDEDELVAPGGDARAVRGR